MIALGRSETAMMELIKLNCSFCVGLGALVCQVTLQHSIQATVQL